MTLIIGMSKRDGIYMSADYRVTRSDNGLVVDDAAIKMIQVTCPPLEDGMRFVMGFAGLARLSDGTPLGEWLLQTIRGESQLPIDLMHHIHDRMNRDLAKYAFTYSQPIMLTALGIYNDERWFGGFSNLNKSLEYTREFGWGFDKLTEERVFLNGSGALSQAGLRGMGRLHKQLKVVPRDPMNHLKLMSIINREVAMADKAVSPFCRTVFIPQDRSKGSATHVFVDRGESVPFRMPHILFGIDLDSMTQHFQGHLEEMRRTGRPPDVDDTSGPETDRRP